jgi:hypothetical protein
MLESSIIPSDRIYLGDHFEHITVDSTTLDEIEHFPCLTYGGMLYLIYDCEHKTKTPNGEFIIPITGIYQSYCIEFDELCEVLSELIKEPAVKGFWTVCPSENLFDIYTMVKIEAGCLHIDREHSRLCLNPTTPSVPTSDTCAQLSFEDISQLVDDISGSIESWCAVHHSLVEYNLQTIKK